LRRRYHKNRCFGVDFRGIGGGGVTLLHILYPIRDERSLIPYKPYCIPSEMNDP
jgi:hypothetical protein